MSQHSDGLDETIEQSLRVAMTTAARVGEVLARVRHQLQERAASESTERARALGSRLDSERQAARATYGRVDDPAWWQTATPDQVAESYTLARAWREADPSAEHAARSIETTIQQRHGLDLASLNADERGPALMHAEQQLAKGTNFDQSRAVRDLVAAEAADQAAAEHARREDNAVTVAAVGSENTQEHGHLSDRDNARAGATAAEADVDAGKGPAAEWDSHERRAQTEEQLRSNGHPENAVEARMLADYAQARPAEDIVRDNKPPRAQARKGRGQSPGQGQNRQKQRTITR